MTELTTLAEDIGSTGAARGARARAMASFLCDRLPFTGVISSVMLLAGVATGSLWSAAADRTWFPQVAYGLPALVGGRWWTVVVGPFFAVGPGFYVPMAGGFALLVGFAEWRLGTRRAALVTVGGHLVGVLGAAGFLLAVRHTGWSWAAHAAGQLDVGLSGGALAALAVVSAVLRPPWRFRVRAALGVYVAVAFLCVGSLADLVHLVAVAAALPAGRRLTRGLGSRIAARPGRREWRLGGVVGLVSIAAASVVVWLLPGDGPLGSTAGADGSWVDIAVTVVMVGVLADGLRRGRRTAWWWAVSLSALNVVSGLAVPVLVGVAVWFGLPYTLDGVAMFVADRLLWVGLLVVLVAGRRAFHVPARRRLRAGLPGSIDRAAATALLQRTGGSTLSWMTTWLGNSHFRTGDGASAVAYRRHAGVTIAVGDPVGPAASRTAAVVEFARMSERAGAVPALFSVTAPTALAAASLGWCHVQVAEDTIVDLPGLPETATTPARNTPPAAPATTAAASHECRSWPRSDPPTPAGTPWSTPPPTPGRATSPPATPPPTRHTPPEDHARRRSPNAATTARRVAKGPPPHRPTPAITRSWPRRSSLRP